MEKILITGANGFLGQHLAAYFFKKNIDIVATGRNEAASFFTKNNIPVYNCELTNSSDVFVMMETLLPSVVIHTAAMSKPDECELDKSACVQINVEATKNLAEAAIRNGCKQFIFTSTDFIFANNEPYLEHDIASPLNFYGESKVSAEKVLHEITKATDMKLCILRPVFIYGYLLEGMRGSFPQWVQRNLKEGKHIKVVTDQKRTPTYVIDICKAIQTMIFKNSNDTFHLAGKEVISPYEFACKVAQLLELDAELIQPVQAKDLKELAERPRYNKLNIDKAIALLDFDPIGIEEGLTKTFL